MRTEIICARSDYLKPVSLYEIGEEPWQFTFTHDAAAGVYVLAIPDGATERFRDNLARHLVVERDPVTGELRPAVQRGQPTYIYLCREQRES